MVDKYGVYRGFPYWTNDSGKTVIYSKSNKRLAIWEDKSFSKAFSKVLNKNKNIDNKHYRSTLGEYYLNSRGHRFYVKRW